MITVLLCSEAGRLVAYQPSDVAWMCTSPMLKLAGIGLAD
jgi:hypothetical protein